MSFHLTPNDRRDKSCRMAKLKPMYRLPHAKSACARSPGATRATLHRARRSIIPLFHPLFLPNNLHLRTHPPLPPPPPPPPQSTHWIIAGALGALVGDARRVVRKDVLDIRVNRKSVA
eukprot:6214837-Pleurochrysis_carterae.AAC.17